MKTILLKFASPLQSWGTSSYFETRQTDLHPSKSGVLGMVAACLGYRREETDKIQQLNKLNFGVRVDQSGQILRDYHIAQKYKEKDGAFDRTYVTNRYYLQDAIFLVGLSHENDQWMEEIYGAMKRPYFQPYLGRRSNPPTYDYLLGIVDQDLVDALKTQEWLARKNYKYKVGDYRNLSIYLDAHLVGEEDKVKIQATKTRKDEIQSLSQKNRQFNHRLEARIDVMALDPDKNTNHDVVGTIGGADVSS